jgi:hypothetical protein
MATPLLALPRAVSYDEAMKQAVVGSTCRTG